MSITAIKVRDAFVYIDNQNIITLNHPEARALSKYLYYVLIDAIKEMFC